MCLGNRNYKPEQISTIDMLFSTVALGVLKIEPPWEYFKPVVLRGPDCNWLTNSMPGGSGLPGYPRKPSSHPGILFSSKPILYYLQVNVEQRINTSWTPNKPPRYPKQPQAYTTQDRSHASLAALLNHIKTTDVGTSNNDHTPLPRTLPLLPQNPRVSPNLPLANLPAT